MARLRRPSSYSNDLEAISACLTKLGLASNTELRMMRIRNTWRLEEVEVSEAFWSDVQERSDLEVFSQRRRMSFDDTGNLRPW